MFLILPGKCGDGNVRQTSRAVVLNEKTIVF